MIDLAADGTLPQTKVKAKLRDIATERRRLTERLDTASADLTASARLIQAALKFLKAHDELYRRCNEQQRRLLNHAIFHGLYIEDNQITDHDLHEPFGQLQALQREHVPGPEAPRPPGHGGRTAKRPPVGRWPFKFRRCPPFLKGVHTGKGSNNNPRVDLTWHKPNSSVLVEGPEIAIRPVGVRRLPASEAE